MSFDTLNFICYGVTKYLTSCITNIQLTMVASSSTINNPINQTFLFIVQPFKWFARVPDILMLFSLWLFPFPPFPWLLLKVDVSTSFFHFLQELYWPCLLCVWLWYKLDIFLVCCSSAPFLHMQRHFWNHGYPLLPSLSFQQVGGVFFNLTRGTTLHLLWPNQDLKNVRLG